MKKYQDTVVKHTQNLSIINNVLQVVCASEKAYDTAERLLGCAREQCCSYNFLLANLHARFTMVWIGNIINPPRRRKEI